jgi:hypothetical protein
VCDEWEVRGDARTETRCDFCTGVTRVLPWLVVSGRDSVATARDVTALSRMEQFVDVGSGGSQLVSMKEGPVSSRGVSLLASSL